MTVKRDILIRSDRSWAEEIRSVLCREASTSPFVRILANERDLFKTLESESERRPAPAVIKACTETGSDRLVELLGRIRSFSLGPLIAILDQAAIDELNRRRLYARGPVYADLPGLGLVPLSKWRERLAPAVRDATNVDPRVWHRLSRKQELEGIRASVAGLSEGPGSDRRSIAEIAEIRERMRGIEGALPILLNHSALREARVFFSEEPANAESAIRRLRRIFHGQG